MNKGDVVRVRVEHENKEYIDFFGVIIGMPQKDLYSVARLHPTLGRIDHIVAKEFVTKLDLNYPFPEYIFDLRREIL